MPIPKSHELTMRCPVCFNREIDVLMSLVDGRYCCLKCSFSGTEAEVRDMFKVAGFSDISVTYTKAHRTSKMMIVHVRKQ